MKNITLFLKNGTFHEQLLNDLIEKLLQEILNRVMVQIKEKFHGIVSINLHQFATHGREDMILAMVSFIVWLFILSFHPDWKSFSWIGM
jgi:hypothetical protein